MKKEPQFLAFAAVVVPSVALGVGGLVAGASRAVAADPSKQDFTKQLGEALGKGIANAFKVSELVTKAATANANGRPGEALALADEALKLDAGSEKAMIERGRALRQLKRLDEAIAHYERAVTRHARSIPLRHGAATTYDDAKQPRKALGHYEALTRLAPKDPDWFAAYGATWYEVGESERAMTELRKALALDPRHPQAHSSLGFILLQLGRAPEAAAIYESWVRADPTNEQAKVRLVEARQQEKSPAKAKAEAEAPAPAAANRTTSKGVAIVVPPPATSPKPSAVPAVVAPPSPAIGQRRSATPPGPDTTVRPKVDRLGGEAVAALRGLPEVVAAGEKARFVGAGEPKIIGQRAVAHGSTGVQVEWAGTDGEGRPAVLRAEVLLDRSGRVAGARTTALVNADNLALARALEEWR